MPVPVVTQPITPRHIAQGVAIPSLQIVGSNTPTSYAATPLPDGLVIDTVTGIITGTPTAAGSTTASITATNGDGTSAAVTLTWSVQASPTGIGTYSDLELDFDLVTREVTIPGAATEGTVFPLVTRDRVNLLIGFKKWGVLQDLSGGGTIGLGFALSEFEPDGSLTLTDVEPVATGSGSTTRYRLPIAISREAWDTLSGYEGDVSTYLDANAEIEVSVGASMRLTSKPFGVHLERDWMASPAVPIISVAPAITGTDVVVGTTWTCDTGTWTNTVLTFAYQWHNAGVAIGAATANTYTLQAGDVGDLITCEVVATNALGSSVPAESNSITPTTYTRTAFLSSTGGTGFLGDNTRPYNSVATAAAALHAAYPAATVTMRLLDSPALGGTTSISTVADRLTVMAHAATPYTLDTALTISTSAAPSADVILDRVTATVNYDENTSTVTPLSGGTITGSNSATVTVTALGVTGAAGSVGFSESQNGESYFPAADGDPPTNGTSGTAGFSATGGNGDAGGSGGAGFDLTFAGSLTVSGSIRGGAGGTGGAGGMAEANGGAGGDGGNATGIDQNGGNGGNGGDGGSATGGDGGTGGTGGDSGTVTLSGGAIDGGINVTGGDPGTGGDGGAATADPGPGGAGGNPTGTGSPGAAGAAGTPGTPTAGSAGSVGSAGANGTIL
jgi:hypothetical protein